MPNNLSPVVFQNNGEFVSLLDFVAFEKSPAGAFKLLLESYGWYFNYICLKTEQ